MKDIISNAFVGFTAFSVALFVGCSSGDNEHAHGDHDHSDHSPTEAAAAPVDGAETMMAMDAKPNPLEKCIVSGEALGSMGEPTVLTHNGQEIKLCCSDCVEGFNKDPEKYLAALSADDSTAHATEEAEGHKH